MEKDLDDLVDDVFDLLGEDFKASHVKIRDRTVAKEVAERIADMLEENKDRPPQDKLDEDDLKQLKALRSKALIASKKKIKLEPANKPRRK